MSGPSVPQLLKLRSDGTSGPRARCAAAAAAAAAFYSAPVAL